MAVSGLRSLYSQDANGSCSISAISIQPPIAPPLSHRFEWIRRLGGGVHGEVWLARAAAHDRFVAIKLLDPVDDAQWAAFKRLIELVNALQDPSVLRVHEMHAFEHRGCIVMDYAPQGELSALRGRPWREGILAVLPITAALARLHRSGIVHRDVKASNVLLMDDGSPRLSDFEAASRLGDSDWQRRSPGSVYGMSPQAASGEPPAIADDIYGFGAMLYELVSGYPPFYPNATLERIRTEVPPRLDARAPIPEALQALIAWCLRKPAEERPSSMDVVAARLWTIVNEATSPRSDARFEEMSNEASSEAGRRPEAPVIRPPSVPAPPLRGEWRRTSDNAPDPALYRRQGFRRGLAVAGVLLAALAIFGVFFVLPKWVEPPPAPVATTPVETTPPPEPAEPTAPVDFAALARAKQDADVIREPLFGRLESLRERGAEQWASEDFARAKSELDAGDTQYAEREYVKAVEHFQALEPLLKALEGKAKDVLQEQLAAGERALNEGRSEDAKRAFDMALRIEPKHSTATRGIERAGTLDRVLALLASAERAEKDGNVSGALADYRKAAELDKDMLRASEGVARTTARLAGDAFASAMARGFAALGNGDYATARSAFESAGQIRPNSSEVADALKQVEQSSRTQTIAGKLTSARDAEANEQWAAALKEYREILALDSTVAAATEGVARVQPRAELNAQLELYVTQPERLFSGPVRAAARQTLERAAAIANPGPLLTGQITKLRDWLARADVPVRVALQSDNLTQVTIFRVGELGAFEQHSLELAPGEYTVLGRRPGYRDVRRQIMVVPGSPMPPIVIRCEDKI